MTWICYRGIELSARTQLFLLGAEVVILASSPSSHSSRSTPSARRLAARQLVVVQPVRDLGSVPSSTACCSESSSTGAGTPASPSTRSPRIPPKARARPRSSRRSSSCSSTSSSRLRRRPYAGTKLLINNSNDVLSVLGTHVFGSPWDKLLIVAVLTSASASTQTTILPTARTTLSMARWGALPEVFGRSIRVSRRRRSRHSAWVALSIVWTMILVGFNPRRTCSATRSRRSASPCASTTASPGLACAVYFRRQLLSSVKAFFLAGVLPLVGCVMMFYVFVQSVPRLQRQRSGLLPSRSSASRSRS